MQMYIISQSCVGVKNEQSSASQKLISNLLPATEILCYPTTLVDWLGYSILRCPALFSDFLKITFSAAKEEVAAARLLKHFRGVALPEIHLKTIFYVKRKAFLKQLLWKIISKKREDVIEL